ncbi:CpaF family protein [Idiomarina xiamenensis]|uniref:FHA domain-containing protein n=1 Tax=Idiomarina xiamenensis 10-D-4 TaxID=740709 RepID=K2JHE8_9GAMM|nr:CpaF family protein [Idiomarina xiamenensis]EKE82761.1 FHA domain-containing protein [Idiomarina xiamenensis 10-D-4]
MSTLTTPHGVAESSALKKLNAEQQYMEQRLQRRLDQRDPQLAMMNEQQLRCFAEQYLHSEFRLPQTQSLAPQVAAAIANVVGLGALEPLLADDEVSEIMINGYDQLFVERGGKITQQAQAFASEGALLAVVERMVTPLGRQVDNASPLLDGRLSNGARIHVALAPVSLNGPVITIRKFRRDVMSLEDWLSNDGLSQAAAEFLRWRVEQGDNIIVAGGTGSGKTTLLNALAQAIPARQRVITIEDAAELQLQQQNLVRLEARPANHEGAGQISIRELVRNALRMRPDRIIVGECRGAEALDMLQAMNTGHDGSLGTIHANSPQDALKRFEMMVLMAGFELPVQAVRQQIVSAVDLLVQLKRHSHGLRQVTAISQITGMEQQAIQLLPLFELAPSAGDAYASDMTLNATGMLPPYAEQLTHHERQQLLAWLL